LHDEDQRAGVPGGALALFTDLYELKMARAYDALGMSGEAVFSLFVRKLPPGRNYLVACGLERALTILEDLRFDTGSLDYLATLQGFDDAFLHRLQNVRFTGDVHAVAEGTPVFSDEPILEVVAPILEAQLVETVLMNVIGLETVLASKAARVVKAAAGRPVIDFGSRRAQGIDAALYGARAFHVAGAASTSNVLAGRRFGIPVAGTMAHSFVQACDDEMAAFRGFARVHPDTVLLVDTYDTLEGVDRVIDLAREFGDDFRVRGIRLDSGDLGALAKAARSRLDTADLDQVQIVASGGLNEFEIARLVADGAPIDAFGVGTDMSVSADAPALDIAYKLTEFRGQGRLKLSTGKRTLPGRKQVFRRFRDGVATGDVIARYEETTVGLPLLSCVMERGRRIGPAPALDAVRRHAAEQSATLPAALRELPPLVTPYPVEVSDRLTALERQVRKRIAAANRPSGGSAH
jgi:nicotinate phosphoribosyltransferase